MEHALPFDPVRGWRTVAMVAGFVAALELVALLALAAKPLWRGIGESAAATGRAPVVAPQHKTTPLPSSVPQLARASTTVLVLNGNGRQGAAAAEAAIVREHGYRIGAVGNAARTGSGQSVVMYRPGFRGEAVRLGRDLGVRLVGPLDGLRPAALRRSQVVVVVGD
jgi:hypothetical protein